MEYSTTLVLLNQKYRYRWNSPVSRTRLFKGDWVVGSLVIHCTSSHSSWKEFTQCRMWRCVTQDSPATSRDLRYLWWTSSTHWALPLRKFLTAWFFIGIHVGEIQEIFMVFPPPLDIVLSQSQQLITCIVWFGNISLRSTNSPFLWSLWSYFFFRFFSIMR